MPRIESIIVHAGPQGPKGNDSVAPGSVATSDGQMIANVGGTITAIAAPTAGQQLRKSKAGPIAWLRGPHVNLADALTAGSSNHTAELRGVIEANGPGYTYHLPAGMTVNLPLGNVPASAVRLRNQVYIEGEGPTSVINTPGSNANPGGNYYAIGVDWNAQAENITGGGISNLTIQGDGPGASQTWTNWQSSAVRILSSTLTQDHLQFRDVIFLNHNGFPIHCDGALSRWCIMERCQFINNGNGPNMNGDFQVFRHCYFTNCEGIENSGAGQVLDGNVFWNVFNNAISVGGNQSSGASKRVFPGNRVVNNLIFNVLGQGAGYGGGVGIILAQSCPSQLIAGNYIQGTYSIGIETTHDNTGNLGDDQYHTIANNELVNCGNTGTSGGPIALWVQTNNTRVIGNHIYDRANNASDPYPLPSGARTLIGCQISAANVLFAENDIDVHLSGTYAVTTTSGGTGIIWGRNALVGGSNGIVQALPAGSTFQDASQLGTAWVTGTGGAFTSNLVSRGFIMASPGVNRTSALHSAVGCPGKQITYKNTDGTFTLTVNPSGTETINGTTGGKVLGANSAVTLTSDGSNWLAQIHYGTFA